MLRTRRPASDNRKSLRKNLVQGLFKDRIALCFAIGSRLDRLLIDIVRSRALHGFPNTLAKFVGLGPKFSVRKLLHCGLKGIDLRNKGPQALHLALVLSPDNLGNDDSDQKLCSF